MRERLPYRVYRGYTADFANASLIEITSGQSLRDEEADPGEVAFYWVRAVNAAGIEGERDEPFFLEVMPARPDLMVGHRFSKLIGDDRYGMSRLAVRKLRIGNRKTVRFVFAAESDERPEEISLIGTKGRSRARFTYYRLGASPGNISAAVWSGLFQTDLLEQGSRELYRIRLRLVRPVSGKTSGRVRGRSVQVPHAADAVQVGVRVLKR